jgi:ribonuclease D
MNYITIENKTKLRSYLKKFNVEGHHTIALDIEAANNLHTYGEKLCLTQIFDGVDSIIIDPLNIDNDSLEFLFKNPNILKVMYDAGSDLSLLKNAHNLEIKSILDLRPAVELLDYDKKDLHSVIACELGITLEKKRKYQQYNWSKRPVSEQAIEYALNDVTHLLILKDIFLAKLHVKKLFEPFLLKNLQIQNKDYTRDPEDKYRKISGYNMLGDDKKVALQKVYDIREKYAKRYDLPAHYIIQKSHLINIVEDPGFIDTMRFPKRIRPGSVRDMVRKLRKAVTAV